MEKKNKEVDISVVIPIYNEEQTIPELYDRLYKTVVQISKNYEFIFVNDGSTDHSLLKLFELIEKDHHVFYISLSRNFGHQIAITAGLDASKGKVVVFIDGDLQDPPELIIDFYKKYKEGYEVVYAKKKRKKRRSFFKKKYSEVFLSNVEANYFH